MAAPRTEVVKDADEIVATREAIKTELARVAAGGEADPDKIVMHSFEYVLRMLDKLEARVAALEA
jgi:hypothetical protein